MEYTVLDENNEASGLLEMRICNGDLSKIMNVDWMPGGIQFFEKQLPANNIYPIAVLDWVETNSKKQNQGIGFNAIRAFRVMAEEHGARLGLLRVGTGGPDDDLESALRWRQRFYERDSWIHRSVGWLCFGCITYYVQFNLKNERCDLVLLRNQPKATPNGLFLRWQFADESPQDFGGLAFAVRIPKGFHHSAQG
jgi:hypothetical protein